MGLTKRFITEMFGSGGDREHRSRVKMAAKFLRWGAVVISFFFVIGFMGYEAAMTMGLITKERNSPTVAADETAPSVDELLSKHGAKLDRAMADGTIDKVLSERGVPDATKKQIKDQIRKRRTAQADKR